MMVESSEKIANEILPLLRNFSDKIDATTDLVNLGDNVCINALSCMLAAFMSEMSVRNKGGDHDKVFADIHKRLQECIMDLMSEYSKSGKSFLADMKEIRRQGSNANEN